MLKTVRCPNRLRKFLSTEIKNFYSLQKVVLEWQKYIKSSEIIFFSDLCLIHYLEDTKNVACSL
jgi:hypothetical protein